MFIAETLLALLAVVLGVIIFCLGLIVAAKIWYYSWFAITFVLVYIQQKGNYSYAQHKLLTKN